MMRILGLVLIVLIHGSAYGLEPPSDETQILKLEEDWVRAMVTKDRKTLDEIVAPGFTFIEPDGTIKNREEYLADRSSEISDTESFDNAELKVSVTGDYALASGLATIKERRQGKTYRYSLPWKEMWMRGKGRWQVLASQATPVNPNWDTAFVIKK